MPVVSLVLQIVHQENQVRATGGRQLPAAQPVVQPAATAEAASEYDKLQPGRRCVLSLPQPQPSSTGGTHKQDDTSIQQPARFTAAVLDVDATTAKQAVRDCAVFIVPQVRTLALSVDAALHSLPD